MDKERKSFLPMLLSICFAAFMSRLDAYIVNVSLPSIAAGFQAGMSDVSRVLLVYLLSLTSTMLTFGKLADRVSLRRLFVLGYAVFTLASLLCGLAPTLLLLVLFRFFQGFGAAMLVIAAYTIISRSLPAHIRGWAYGLISTAAALGLMIGAPLGGLITGYLSWHWIFLINVPVGVVAVVTAWRVIPDGKALSEAKEKAKPFDYLGAGLSFMSVLALSFVLNNGNEHGWGSPPILTAIGLFIVLCAAFLAHERKHPDPLLNLALFRVCRFDLVLGASVGAIAVLGGNGFLMPFYLEMGKGLAPQQSGLVLMVYSIVFVIIGPVAGRLSDKVRPGLLCLTGMVSAAAACCFFAGNLSLTGLIPVVAFLVWLGVSFSLFISPNANQIMSLAPEGQQGTASGVFNLFQQLGQIVGVCIFESVFTTLYPAGLHLEAGRTSTTAALWGAFRETWLVGAAICLGAAVITLTANVGKQAASRPRKSGEAAMVPEG